MCLCHEINSLSAIQTLSIPQQIADFVQQVAQLCGTFNFIGLGWLWSRLVIAELLCTSSCSFASGMKRSCVAAMMNDQQWLCDRSDLSTVQRRNRYYSI